MRVAHIIKVTRISGAERHLLLLLPALRQREHDARLVLLVEPGNPMDDMLGEARSLGIPAIRLTIQRDLDPSLPPRLRRVLRAIQPDIVHTHLVHADIYGAFAARLAPVAAVISSRHNDDRFRYHPLWRRMSPWLWRMHGGGIAISGAIKRFAVEFEGAPADKIRVVPYGMRAPWLSDADLRSARDRLRCELELPQETPILGLVCRLVEQKGIGYALEAFARIADRYPEARLVIAGDGELGAQLKRQARSLGIDGRAHWLGWRDDSLDLIAAFDIMLMPSLWEGFGLALLEAMSRRVPIIASRVSAIPEVVSHGETGLLVDARDAAGLSQAMRRLLDDRALRQHMGLLGAARLEEHFSIESMVDGTLAAYEAFGKTQGEARR